jgi:D-alanyl-D-alanine carboxypeptidase
MPFRRSLDIALKRVQTLTTTSKSALAFAASLTLLGPLAACGAPPPDSLAAILSARYSARGPAVAVFLDRGPAGTDFASIGLADRDRGLPARKDDHFRIGSITKSFVALALLDMQQDGLIDLDDPLSEWVDADLVEGIEGAEDASLRQLANMSSGLFDYLEEEDFWLAVADEPSFPWVPRELLFYAYGHPPAFAAGQGYGYSNTNYLLLQLAMERASGMDLDDILQQRVIRPLGLEQTWLELSGTPQGSIVPSLADINGDGALDDARLLNDGTGMADGGLVSRASDLATFARALYKGDLLDDAAQAELMTTIDAGDNEGYGLGISRIETEFGEAWGHEGATGGFQAFLWYLPAIDTSIVAWTNSEASDLDGLLEAVLGLIADRQNGEESEAEAAD